MLWSIFGMLAAVISACVWIYFLWVRRQKRNNPGNSLKPDNVMQQYDSFRSGLKAEGITPEKTIQYGHTRFAYDKDADKAFVQTERLSQGMAFYGADIAYFDLFRDGAAIESKDLPLDPYGETAYSGEACFDLHITIRMRNGSEIVLPFIDAPTGYEYAYTCAVKAAVETAEVLEGILRQQAFAARDTTKAQKSSMPPFAGHASAGPSDSRDLRL